MEAFGESYGAVSQCDGCLMGIDLAGRGRAAPEIGAEKARGKKRGPGCPGGGASACATATHRCQRAVFYQRSESRFPLLAVLEILDQIIQRRVITDWNDHFTLFVSPMVDRQTRK
jgi:hypothetical protein